MQRNLEGKRLLILGSCEDEISMVQRAQEMGCYVIVTDYFTDPFRTPAKRIADEAWNDNWQDTDLIVRKCKDNKIDGVIAGYSEIKIDYLIRICEKLGLPCYCNKEQLEITRDKIKFKDECRKNRVPVVKEYSSPQSVNRFPVIVKPVDRGGSIGISVANNRNELEKAYKYAMEMSLTKQVIIEDFIYKGNKIDVYYAILDGKIILLGTGDTINAKNNGFERVVQSGWMLPSKYEKLIREKADLNLQRMIQNMGIKNGFIFFSGFADDEGYIAFFECGFRMSGGHLYNYFREKGLPSFLDIFLFHSLTGSTLDLRKSINENPNMKCAVVNFYSKTGKIKDIKGIESITTIPECKCSLIDGHVGEECDEDKAILSKIAMFYFCSESPKILRKNVERTYQDFAIIGENGEDLIYDRMDTEQIEKWWEYEERRNW